MDSNTIEDLVTQIVNDQGVDYEEAVEILRQAIDDLYGPRPMNVTP